MIRRPPRSTQSRSSAASDVYKRQVFDSGLGGISVVHELRRRLPAEDLLYYADCAWCPYGIRSPEEIRERSSLVVGTLIRAGAKAVVVACNTASAMAILHLREV